MEKITRAEYELKCAERTGKTIEQLRAEGFYAAPCDCEWDRCEGWQGKWDMDIVLDRIAERLDEQGKVQVEELRFLLDRLRRLSYLSSLSH